MNPRRSLSAVAVAFVLTLSVTACGSSDEPTSVALDDPELALGAEVYLQSCASCHGTDLRGTDQGPPHLDIVYEPSHHSDVAFQLAVQRGVAQHHWNFGPMPPIPGLDEADIADITAYVREQQRAAGIE